MNRVKLIEIFTRNSDVKQVDLGDREELDFSFRELKNYQWHFKIETIKREIECRYKKGV